VPRRGRGAAAALPQAVLPRMRGFTFLRLTPEMLSPPYAATWGRFVARMRGGGGDGACAAPPAGPDPAPAAGGGGAPLPTARSRSAPDGGLGGAMDAAARLHAAAARSYSGSGVFVANAAGEMVPVEALEAGGGRAPPPPAGPTSNGFRAG